MLVVSEFPKIHCHRSGKAQRLQAVKAWDAHGSLQDKQVNCMQPQLSCYCSHKYMCCWHKTSRYIARRAQPQMRTLPGSMSCVATTNMKGQHPTAMHTSCVLPSLSALQSGSSLIGSATPSLMHARMLPFM